MSPVVTGEQPLIVRVSVDEVCRRIAVQAERIRTVRGDMPPPQRGR